MSKKLLLLLPPVLLMSYGFLFFPALITDWLFSRGKYIICCSISICTEKYIIRCSISICNLSVPYSRVKLSMNDPANGTNLSKEVQESTVHFSSHITEPVATTPDLVDMSRTTRNTFHVSSTSLWGCRYHQGTRSTRSEPRLKTSPDFLYHGFKTDITYLGPNK
jgi:hypothetical protein